MYSHSEIWYQKRKTYYISFAFNVLDCSRRVVLQHYCGLMASERAQRIDTEQRLEYLKTTHNTQRGECRTPALVVFYLYQACDVRSSCHHHVLTCSINFFISHVVFSFLTFCHRTDTSYNVLSFHFCHHRFLNLRKNIMKKSFSFILSFPFRSIFYTK